MVTLAAVLAAFSIVAALILLFAYLFFLENMQKTWIGKAACVAVLLGLAALQWNHFAYFTGNHLPLASRAYCVFLVLLPAAFLFFSREVVFPDRGHHRRDALHTVPVIASLILPLSAVPLMAFVVGSVYTAWFARNVYFLRRQHQRFRFEIFFFGLFAAMALLGLLMGLALPVLDHAVFYQVYSNAISLAMILVVAALLIFPELLTDIVLLAELAYANSKLTSVDVAEKLAALEHLMKHDRQFQNEDLSLATVADQLNLSSHQLSELINSQYGMSFPRYVRQHRIHAAKELLLAEPEASILSISMEIGFRSQSSFYAAFKEECGQSPGRYRINAS